MIEKKRGKDEEINREAIWPVMMGKKKWSPKVWGLSVVVKNCVSESKQREEKNRKRNRKLWKIHCEKESIQWKEKKSFFILYF